MPPMASETRPKHEDATPLVDVSSWVRESPPWLASLLLHLMVVLVLGLLWITGAPQRPLTLDADYAEDLGEQLLEEPLELDVDPDPQPVEQVFSPTDLPVVDDPLSAPELTLPIPDPTSSLSSSPAEMNGAALNGREPGMKAVLLRTYGGTETTEQAVMDGLRWLARNQLKNGAWSLKGPYSDGASLQTDNHEAATAMALLAFQGAGFTHKDPPGSEFGREVAKGWNRLLDSQDEEGNFYRNGGFNHDLYTHAQCTIALCELYAMTQDESLRDAAQLAVDYCLKTQSESGGWRYKPRVGADTSVTGWFVMALKSAQMAGLDVPSEVFFRISKYLDSVARDRGSRYSYQRRDGATLSMTAEGLLCRQYLGWRHDDERLRRGVYYLLDNLPRATKQRRNVYYWYYATQVCHHMEGEEWTKWNSVTREVVPRLQEKSGRERGSWDRTLDRVHGAGGGRLYTTCMAIYILEVYYRHLPLYRQGLLTNF